MLGVVTAPLAPAATGERTLGNSGLRHPCRGQAFVTPFLPHRGQSRVVPSGQVTLELRDESSGPWALSAPTCGATVLKNLVVFWLVFFRSHPCVSDRRPEVFANSLSHLKPLGFVASGSALPLQGQPEATRMA